MTIIYRDVAAAAPEPDDFAGLWPPRTKDEAERRHAAAQQRARVAAAAPEPACPDYERLFAGTTWEPGSEPQVPG